MAANENNTVVLYQDEDGITRVDVRFSGEDVWLTRDQIAQLYSTTPQNLSLHIGNIYADQELDENPTRKKFFLVRQEGNRNVKREIDHYRVGNVVVSCPPLCLPYMQAPMCFLRFIALKRMIPLKEGKDE